MGHLFAVDDVEARLRVEALHEDERAAGAVHRHRPHQRRRVVERRRGQVHLARREPHHTVEQRADRVLGPVRLAGDEPAHALRASRRPRRVQHRRTFTLVLERLVGDTAHERAERLEAVDVAGDRDEARDPWDVLTYRARESSHRGSREEHGRAAVVDHVGGFVDPQAGVDGREVQTRSLGRPGELEHRGAVVEQQRDVIAGTQPRRPECRARPGSHATRARRMSRSRRPPPSRSRVDRDRVPHGVPGSGSVRPWAPAHHTQHTIRTTHTLPGHGARRSMCRGDGRRSRDRARVVRASRP